MARLPIPAPLPAEASSLRGRHSPIQARLGVPAPRAESANTIYLYDIIDAYWGVSAKDVAGALEAASGGPITVRVNSPGGDVFEARAIATLLRGYSGAVDVHIDGLAASAASYIAISGDKCTMAKGAMIMIHNAWSGVWGNANDMMEMAAVLEKIDGMLADDYAAKCGKPKDEILAAMSATSWYTAEEAQAFGLVDAIADPRRTATDQPEEEPDEDDPAAALAMRFDGLEFIELPQAMRERFKGCLTRMANRLIENTNREIMARSDAAVIQAAPLFTADAEERARRLRLLQLAANA